MTYTQVGFSRKSGFKKIVLTQELVLVLNRDSQKYCLHQFSLYSVLSQIQLVFIILQSFLAKSSKKYQWLYFQRIGPWPILS